MSIDVTETEPTFLPSQRGQGLGRRIQGLQGLEGDSICFGGDCHDGDAAVRQMLSTFNSFKDRPGIVDKFKAQVDDIRTQAESVGFFSRFFILGGGCCQMKEIGTRAITITKAMFAAVGQAAPPTPAINPDSAIEKLFSLALPIVLIGGGIYFFGPSIRNWITKKTSVNGLEKDVQKLLPRSFFDQRSFRWVKSGKAKVLIGCPKGRWSPKRNRCRVGTRAYEVVK